MSYLARLKALTSDEPSSGQPSKPSKTAFEPFDGGSANGENENSPASATCFDERATIVQVGANVPREWAEGFAKLEACPVSPGENTATWLAMMNAAGRFLDRWANKAAALGWTAGELFGLDAEAPINRRDHRGAAFFLIGRDVVDVTATEIKMMDGANVLTMRRRGGFTLPAWEGPE